MPPLPPLLPPSLSDDFNEHIFCLNSSINFTVEKERESERVREKKEKQEKEQRINIDYMFSFCILSSFFS